MSYNQIIENIGNADLTKGGDIMNRREELKQAVERMTPEQYKWFIDQVRSLLSASPSPSAHQKESQQTH